MKDVSMLFGTPSNEVLWNAISSDHAPCAMEKKKTESVREVNPDIAGLTLKTPAEIFHLSARGTLSEGYHADLVVVDVKREYKIDASRFHSKAKFSPFDGWKVKGKPVKTFVNGNLVMDEGEIVAKSGTGQIIR